MCHERSWCKRGLLVTQTRRTSTRRDKLSQKWGNFAFGHKSCELIEVYSRVQEASIEEASVYNWGSGHLSINDFFFQPHIARWGQAEDQHQQWRSWLLQIVEWKTIGSWCSLDTKSTAQLTLNDKSTYSQLLVEFDLSRVSFVAGLGVQALEQLFDGCLLIGSLHQFLLVSENDFQ